MLAPVDIPEFQKALLAWYRAFRRDLPWRRSSEPYAIWISEVMLQQTRVAAAIDYYRRFLARFPDFRSLAEATESELLAYWSGLGYYYRARNLWAAAKTMAIAGTFPSTYEGIRELPGVGDYTAAAVSSIAFGLPHAVLDGNVFRVLSRLFADDTNIASGAGRKRFSTIADSLLARESPGDYNQAVMELGATICLPRNPQCLLCPVAQFCRARAQGTQSSFPVKVMTTEKKEESRTLFWIEETGQVLAWQRPLTLRLMPGFWELPEAEQLPEVTPTVEVGSFRHGITVHNYRFRVIASPRPLKIGSCQWLPIESLHTLPVSTVFRKAVRLVQKSRNSRYAVHVAS